MKTIVNIPDYLYEHLNEIIRGSMSSMLILDYVKQGTPLPKGHGRIVDENEITSFGWNYKANHASVNAPTIIEADKGEEEMTNGEEMDFPDTFDEFAEDYGFKDEDEIYTNGSELIQVYRVKQWLEHISTTKNDIRDNRVKDELNGVENELDSTTKNDLEVDCISRADAIKAMQNKAKELKNEDTINGLCGAVAILFDLPSVTPWIPVSERLPEDHKDVLAYLSSDRISICRYNSHKLPFSNNPIGWGYLPGTGFIDFEKEHVIAWMPYQIIVR